MKIQRGLGKNDIWVISNIGCHRCGKTDPPLYKETIDGKKVYLCKNCSEIYHLKLANKIIGGDQP